jgi:hypothetical protein
MSDAQQEQPDLPDWPMEWPECSLVDLDNVGDPGAWLDEEIPTPEDLLSMDEAEEQALAENLSSSYVARLEDLGAPLPSDFDVTEDEMMSLLKSEFLGFLREWRKQATAAGCTATPPEKF